jgi:hypothetical protein
VRRYLFPILLLAILLLTIAPASAETDEGRITINHGDHYAISMKIEDANTDISWEITVTSGPPIDVYFVPSGGYKEYKNPQSLSFSYYPSQSDEGTDYSSESFEWDNTGTFYIVIDNSEIGRAMGNGDPVQVTYEASWEGPGWTAKVMNYLCVVAFLGAIIGWIYFKYRVRKWIWDRPKAPPMPPPGYPQQGYQQPGYPPQQHPPGSPPPPAYRQGPPPRGGYPQQPPPAPYAVHETEDTTYIVEDHPSSTMDSDDYYSQQLAEKKSRGRY